MCQKVDVFSECLCYSMSYFTEMLVLALSEIRGKPEPEQPGALPDVLLRNNLLPKGEHKTNAWIPWSEFMIRQLVW